MYSYRRGVEQRAFASSNSLRVAPTHSPSLKQLAEEGAMNNNAQSIMKTN
jgi:hypothetical protein